MRLTYTGADVRLIPDLRLKVSPGEEFDSPADIAAALLVRPDFKRAAKPQPKEA